MKWKPREYQSALEKSGAAPSGNTSSTLKVELRPVPWSHGPSSQSTFVAELSTLISSLLSTRQMTTRGSLLLRLANGWAFDPVGGGAYRMTVTLSCQVERCGETKTHAISKYLST